MFKELIGKTMEVYINDMLVKSLQAADHIAHLKEAFGVLRKHRMILNHSKCIFGVSSGKFLGFLVTKRGIEANSDQIQALITMNSPKNIREVQQLTRRVAALNRFISKLADKCLPFFRILRKNQTFQWDEESENNVLVAQGVSRFAAITHCSYNRRGTLRISVHLAYRKPETTPPKVETPKEQSSNKDLARWILFVDGSFNQHECGTRLIIQTSSREQMEYAIKIGFKATNDEAEYIALLAGLRVEAELGAEFLDIFSDSQLVVNQVQGDYHTKDTRMIAYLDEVRLERSKSEWAEELPSILWAYHTTSRIPTGETPYSMIFKTESVIPVEIGMPNFRTSNFDKENNIELRLNLDLLNEKREMAELRQVAYKCQVTKYYNQRVKHRSFLLGDLVLRKVTLSTKEPNAGKLGPTWEGPYKVIKVSRPRTYWLEDLSGKALSHPWNAEHLKKFYQ
ncbi:uncharacterized protein LOC130751495 [Actinidia eriantha]|uniref:uncharacterized protein LOC130751495 n=1 Tax=Actinidia eriantha TaxID=165200 RepID=UPI00258B26C7|nr:uncharacterized protein LOC130751495 [Actinidia eriantha]